MRSSQQVKEIKQERSHKGPQVGNVKARDRVEGGRRHPWGTVNKDREQMERAEK